MFYSEALLAKTGPLARVWLAANLERKLTKQNVLQSDINNNVRDIIGTGQAPMALRLSGQLLLGVVRIYSKKAKYLFDDCSEALGRLKMAFRPGNVDLPTNQLLATNPNALTLPDTITEQDLFAEFPNPDDLFREPAGLSLRNDGNLLDFDTSQLLPETQSTPTSKRHSRPMAALEQDDLNLDFDYDEPSIEIGREAKAALPDGPSLLQDDLGLDFGFGETTIAQDDDTLRGADLDAPMIDNDNTDLNTVEPVPQGDVEDSFRLNGTAIDEIDETAVQAAQRVKRRKVLHQDVETELHGSLIKKQQEDRSNILRAPNYLPQDPFLLQLIEAQRSGAFVSSILGDGRMLGMAPELRGVCSIEVIRKVGEKKRKRDSGIADVETSSERLQSSPRLDIPLDDDFSNIHHGQDGFGGDTSLDHGTAAIMDEDQIAAIEAYDIDGPSTQGPAFDHTEAPLLHPSHSGPVSLGTKTAVAALRQHFAPGHIANAPPTPSKRTRAEARFTDLCPHQSTNRADATKMFFELLVLGTKDAVKIEQEKGKGLEGDIRVRGKRGLWEGTWAELAQGQQGSAVTTL